MVVGIAPGSEELIPVNAVTGGKAPKTGGDHGYVYLALTKDGHQEMDYYHHQLLG
jgi:hypothetical protein